MLARLRSRPDVVLLATWVWVRVMVVMASDPFEMPDTVSYTGAAWMRPPVGRVLLSRLPVHAYVLVSVLLSTAGFVALAVTVRRRCTGVVRAALTAAVVVVSLAPMSIVFEHWLVPDSMLAGLGLLGVVFAVEARRRPGALLACVAAAVLLTLTKETGAAIAVLVLLLALASGAPRRAVVGAIAACVVLFTVVVPPASARTGSAYWGRGDDSEISLDRFRVLVVSLIWPDLGPDFAVIEQRAEECGMPLVQLVFETFGLAEAVPLDECDALWERVDDIGQADILLAHLRDPRHVGSTIGRSFANDMSANLRWSDTEIRPAWWSAADRWIAGAVGVTPLIALGWCAVRRRGRRTAVVGVASSAAALAVGLMDPSAQDRHTIALRLVAAAVAAVAIADAQRPAGSADGPLRIRADDVSSTGS